MVSGTGTTFIFIFLRAAKFKLAAVCSMQEGSLAHNVSRVTSFTRMHMQQLACSAHSPRSFFSNFFYFDFCILRNLSRSQLSLQNRAKRTENYDTTNLVLIILQADSGFFGGLDLSQQGVIPQIAALFLSEQLMLQILRNGNSSETLSAPFSLNPHSSSIFLASLGCVLRLSSLVSVVSLPLAECDFSLNHTRSLLV